MTIPDITARIRAGISLILVAGVLSGGCTTVPITGRRQLDFIPSSELLSVGGDNYRQIVSEAKLSSDVRKVQTVKNVGDSIARAAEQFLRENKLGGRIKDYSWEFNLIDDDQTVNAFCLPGGKVAVYTGILKITRDESGLATVIAHEVAHAIANHGGERMSQMLLAQFGATTLSAALAAKKETTKQYTLLAYGAVANLGVVLPYSRIQEKEADHIGLILMARAGYDPHSAVEIWQ
ncbi:MAG: M48 family metallopeptidase, partial [Candidatus Omnitrophica bacterium]|nr:M48 family metallopeptidase [Candidatus Omnitrophota bacterium]